MSLENTPAKRFTAPPLPADFDYLEKAGLTSLPRIAAQEAARLGLPVEVVLEALEAQRRKDPQCHLSLMGHKGFYQVEQDE
jgi:hypothetical protein